MSSGWMSMSSSKQKILFIVAILVLQVVFLFVLKQDVKEGEKPITYNFFLNNAECTPQEYVYYLCEHIAWIYAFYLMYMEIKSISRQLWYFFLISIFDSIDYLATYNSVWFRVLDIPISFNVIMVILVCWIFYDTD